MCLFIILYAFKWKFAPSCFWMMNFDIFGLLFHTKRYIVQLTVPKICHDGSIVAQKNIDSETKHKIWTSSSNFHKKKEMLSTNIRLKKKKLKHLFSLIRYGNRCKVLNTQFLNHMHHYMYTNLWVANHDISVVLKRHSLSEVEVLSNMRWNDYGCTQIKTSWICLCFI